MCWAEIFLPRLFQRLRGPTISPLTSAALRACTFCRQLLIMAIAPVVLRGRLPLLWLFSFFQLWAVPLRSQTVTIQGQIFSKSTGNSIASVSVFVSGNKTDTGTVADDNGKYAIAIRAEDSVFLQFSADNYEKLNLPLSLGNKK